MANYYTEFSEELENLTPEEVAWCKARLRELSAEVEEKDGIGSLGFDFQFISESEGDQTLWFHSEETGHLEILPDFVREFLSKFRPTDAWSLTWADTCSKPQIGAFGGGAVFVTPTRITYINSYAWVATMKQLWEKKEMEKYDQ